MINWNKTATIGMGKNISGIYIGSMDYVLIYSVRNNMLSERKYIVADGAVENINGKVVSYSDCLVRSGGLRVELAAGRLING